jgi:hypothetical protein
MTWLITGNAGTNPNNNFLGTTDNQPLAVRVNNQRALRIEPDATSPNLIGGSADNEVQPGVIGATIGGGGKLGFQNLVSAEFGTISGGLGNTVSGARACVGGGTGNRADGLGATVGGGSNNEATQSHATISGGLENSASGLAASVVGGEKNTAEGDFAQAAGRRAKALHTGAFVWADATDDDFTSTGNNQFLIRAAGGVGIGTGNLGRWALTIRANDSSEELISFQDPSGRARWHINQNLGGNRPGLNFVETGVADGRLFLQAGGNVGIGTTTPGSKLSVAGHLDAESISAFKDVEQGQSVLNVVGRGKGTALSAVSGKGTAAFFGGEVSVAGNLVVLGTLFKSRGAFRIDHPLDPENKYLCHSFVESPDMKNLYDGVVVLDHEGEARVELPVWFEVLNGDVRYQLTAIGKPAPNLHVATEIEGHGFKIAGGGPAMRVAWQVTGNRQDPFARAYPLAVEQEKPPEIRGTYLHPEAYGQPAERGAMFQQLDDALRL